VLIKSLISLFANSAISIAAYRRHNSKFFSNFNLRFVSVAKAVRDAGSKAGGGTELGDKTESIKSDEDSSVKTNAFKMALRMP
jgi:hypothetical protein